MNRGKEEAITSKPQLRRGYTASEIVAQVRVSIPTFSVPTLISYAKRGLIDPPRRVGRYCYYGAATMRKIPVIWEKKHSLAWLAPPIPRGHLSTAETARQARISVTTLRRYRDEGLIPQPERHGRSLTYPADIVSVILDIIKRRRVAAAKKRAEGGFSQEFLAHQGQLNNPDILQNAHDGYREMLEDPKRREEYGIALATAAKRPSVQRKKSEAMKRRMAEKKAELERLRRMVDKDAKPAAKLESDKEYVLRGREWKAEIPRLKAMFDIKKQLPKKVQADYKALRRGLLACGFTQEQIEAAWNCRYHSPEAAAQRLVGGRHHLEPDTMGKYCRKFVNYLRTLQPSPTRTN